MEGDTNNGFHRGDLRAGPEESTEEEQEEQTDDEVGLKASDDDMQNIYGKLISELSLDLRKKLKQIQEENENVQEEKERIIDALKALRDIAESNLELTEQCTLRF